MEKENELKSESNFLKKFDLSISNWFDDRIKLAIICCFIFGILVHFTFLSEILLSQDGIWNSLDAKSPYDWEISLGRWGIMFVDRIANYLSIPNITGIISLLLVTISTISIINLLNIKSKPGIILTSFAMMASPALATTMIYAFTSISYCMALLLASISARLMFTEKFKIISRILSSILIAFMMSLYQAYLGVVVGLAVLKLILNIIDRKYKAGQIIIQGIVVITITVIAGVVYLCVTNIILENTGLTLSNYNGASSISISNSIINLPNTITNCYKDFANFYFTDDIVFNSNFNRQILWGIFFCIFGILEIYLVIAKKVWENALDLILILVLTLIIPLAFSCIVILVVDYSLYILTSSQFVLIIPFILAMIDRLNYNLDLILKYATILITFAIIHTYFLSISASYSSMKFTADQFTQVVNRILTRMELDEDYSSDKTVMFTGRILDESLIFSARSEIYNYTLSNLFRSPVIHGSYDAFVGTWQKAINAYLGTRIVFCSTPDYQRIIETEQYKNMGIYPDKNSIDCIEGVMVVKLLEDAPKP